MKGERHEAMEDKLARLAQVSINYRIPPASGATTLRLSQPSVPFLAVEKHPGFIRNL